MLLSTFFILIIIGDSSVHAESKETATPKKPPPADDLEDLKPYLVVVTIVPNDEDEAAIGSGKDNKNYTDWLEKISKKLEECYELANIETTPTSDEEPVVKIQQIDLKKQEDSNRLRIAFYVSVPPVGPIPSKDTEAMYARLSSEKLWKAMDRRVLMYPTPVSSTKPDKTSRTLSIIAFVMGWVCLAALIVILAYLGIKYRDGIKSLARRIEQWSNPNRNGYSNLGGDSVPLPDWRTEVPVAGGETRDPPADEQKPKKKLRAPGGLLTDVDRDELSESEIMRQTTQQQSYGTYQDQSVPDQSDTNKDNNTQIRLAQLAQLDGSQTPPLTPTSMQKHLIKKYQDKQAEEQSRDDALTATNSEVFPDDFADCVEEEEIFQIKP